MVIIFVEYVILEVIGLIVVLGLVVVILIGLVILKIDGCKENLYLLEVIIGVFI